MHFISRLMSEENLLWKGWLSSWWWLVLYSARIWFKLNSNSNSTIVGSNLYSTSTFSLKLTSQMKRTYNKTRLMTPFQCKNDALSFDFCVSQSNDDKSALLAEAASRSLIKSVYRVLCNMYLALFMLFTSTNAESPIMVLALNPRSRVHELSIKLLSMKLSEDGKILRKKFLGELTEVLW